MLVGFDNIYTLKEPLPVFGCFSNTSWPEMSDSVVVRGIIVRVHVIAAAEEPVIFLIGLQP